ncbi:GNAT family N-acetyltransferase [Streptococcus iniae]|uniref:GNAT family N-acetyltransferase n=1 Tax=Streptococcus iniae TaxID=1346 RepID=UPI000EF81508|nr:GNAT family N-acetyltransferase [Streptococcus iniae]RLV43968.1 GNAT family N-acetyltransferase [Streptococcus iniae]
MWTIKTFQELTTEELFHILKARVDVFVVEQACAYPEIDNLDKDSYHLFHTNNKQQLDAYCRLIPSDKLIKLGRVLTSKTSRKTGLGRQLVEQALGFCLQHYPDLPVYAQAQAHLQNFYASFGFKATSNVYLEDDIPHIDMIKK